MADIQPIPTHPRFQDLTGQSFERLTVIGYSGRSRANATLWLCLCECGKSLAVQAGGLKTGSARSCGCHREGIPSFTRRNLVGAVFGRLTVLQFHETRKNKAFWICRCECGTETSVATLCLVNGNTKSCGCYKRQSSRDRHFRVKSGQVFGRITVIEYHGKKKWRCRCSCGQTLNINGSSLLQGNTKSCGCYKIDLVAAMNRSHGLTETSEYSAWCHLKARCLNKNNPAYPDYGGRGIMVCERYRESFANFLVDIGPKPAMELSLDRTNNDLGYSCGVCQECQANGWPFNIRWATASQQILNSSRAHFVTFNDETLPISEWAVRLGVNVGTLSQRLKKYPPEIAFTKPKKRNYAESILFKRPKAISTQEASQQAVAEQTKDRPPAGYLF